MKIFIFFILNALGGALAGQPTVYYSTESQEIVLDSEAAYFLDESKVLSLSQIQSKPFVAQITDNYGTTEATLWLRFRYVNASSETIYFEIRNALIEELDFFLCDSLKLINHQKTGKFYSQLPKDLANNFYNFRLPVTARPLWVYVRVRSTLPIQIPMRLVTHKTLLEQNHQLDILQGAYIGLVWMMLFYNLFLFFSFEDRLYLYYVGYVLFSSLLITDFKGYSTELIWSNIAPWLPRYVYVLTAIANIFSLAFAYNFLNISQTFPYLKRVFWGLSVVSFITIIPGLFGFKTISELALQPVTGGIALFLLGLGLVLWSKGVRQAKFFTSAWVVFLIGVVIFILQIDGFIPSNWLTLHAIQIGSALETVLLSLALADRINILKIEKEKAQSQSINQLQETERLRSKLARDLHDDMGSTLSSISILSQIAQNQQDEAQQKELLHKISHRSQKMLDALHDIVWTNQATNDTLGEVLVHVREFAAEMFDAQSIAFRIETSDKLTGITFIENRHYDFYLIIKEGLNNIAKYAEATQVVLTIWLDKKTNKLVMVLSDNGKGFDAQAEHNGNGIKNMKKRAANLNGIIEFFSSEMDGTHLQLSVPPPVYVIA